MTNLNNWYYSITKEKATKSANPVRFGILSAALINPTALFDTARTHPDAVVVAIAARSLEKAQAQCKKYGIPDAYGSYDDLLAQPDIDAVYIPLPNGLHFEWAIKAMKAGKHVLIEKPIASNAEEARKILACAQETGKVALEAFHWQFHPAAHVVKALIDSGRYGNVTATSAYMVMPAGMISDDDIRFKYDKLAGGACMDLTYVFSTTRYFVGAYDDYEVLEAVPRINKKDKKIDDSMKTTLLFRMGEGRPDVRSTTHADLCEPKLWGFIPMFWHTMNVNVVIELEKATITFIKYVLRFVTRDTSRSPVQWIDILTQFLHLVSQDRTSSTKSSSITRRQGLPTYKSTTPLVRNGDLGRSHGGRHTDISLRRSSARSRAKSPSIGSTSRTVLSRWN